MIKNNKFTYDTRIVVKPWGEEYNIFRNKKKFAITYLKIKKNLSTSLHCHPRKKTGFLRTQEPPNKHFSQKCIFSSFFRPPEKGENFLSCR